MGWFIICEICVFLIVVLKNKWWLNELLFWIIFILMLVGKILSLCVILVCVVSGVLVLVYILIFELVVLVIVVMVFIGVCVR